MDKCLAFCKTLAMSNQKFTFSLSLGKDNFNFSNKELVKSYWKMKKKSSSQQRRQERRKCTKTNVADKVTECDVVKVSKKVCKVVSAEETESSLYFNCELCDFEVLLRRV